MSLGPGVPDPPVGIPVALQISRHRIRSDGKVIAQPGAGYGARRFTVYDGRQGAKTWPLADLIILLPREG